MTDSPEFTPSDLVAERIKERRSRLGLSTKTLAERCAALGAPHITAPVLMNIESGRRDASGRRRRAVTVDELLVLAYALEASPIPMLLPELNVRYPITDETVSPARWVFEWILGERLPPLPSGEDGEISHEDRARAWFEFSRMLAYSGPSTKPLTVAERYELGAMTDWRYSGQRQADLDRMPPEQRDRELAAARYLAEHKDDPDQGMAGLGELLKAERIKRENEKGEQDGESADQTD